MSSASRIGLCMIVKDEAHVMRRCLDSVKPLLDYVLVEDTGSSDGTQDIIRAWLAEHGIPGEVVDVSWRDFAWNRSHALELLRARADIGYALVIDADDTLGYEPGFDAAAFKAGLGADFYWMEVRHGDLRHRRPHLMRNSLPFRYRGVLHEFVESPPGSRGESIRGVYMRIDGGGARSADPTKFQRDAALLEDILRTEQDPFLRSRYTFYLAQSYRDADVPEKALEHYQARATMGYWQEEIYISLYKAAALRERLGHEPQDVIDAYRRAADAAPLRAEALHGASRYCRLQRRFEQGYVFARQGLERRAPGGLFEEAWIYDYALLDEWAVNAYWCQCYEDCRDACRRLLAEGRFPEAMRARVEANLGFAEAKLAERGAAGKGAGNG